MKIIDITRDVKGVEVYPGDPEPEFTWRCRIGENADYNLSSFAMSSHTGTHADAPLHFLDGGDAIDRSPLDNFIGPCRVIEVRGGVITGAEAEQMLPLNCERLLIKGHGRAFFMDASAELFADSGLKLIGTDALSIGSQGNEMKPHKAFLQGGVSILEGLNLDEVRPGEYYLFAAPMKLNGLEGAPVRAALVEDFIFWSGKN